MILDRFKRLITGKIPLGYFLYKILCKKNKSRFFVYLYQKFFYKNTYVLNRNVKLITTITEDGFNQANHPDIIFFKGVEYITFTSYPYCDEKLENPYIFAVDNDGYLKKITNNPVAIPKKTNYRRHFSDPAFFSDGINLVLTYRECIHKKNKRRFDIIYRITTCDCKEWSKPQIIMHEGFSCISPSFLYGSNSCDVFYVSDDADETILLRGLLVNNRVVDLRIIPTPPIDGYYIWHIDIKKYSNMFIGLFTYISNPRGGNTRLFLLKSNNGNDWNLLKEVSLSQRGIINLYKSTFEIKNNNVSIFVSAVDNKMRWFIYKVEGIGEWLNEDYASDSID